jgi:hypothetical protein
MGDPTRSAPARRRRLRAFGAWATTVVMFAVAVPAPYGTSPMAAPATSSATSSTTSSATPAMAPAPPSTAPPPGPPAASPAAPPTKASAAHPKPAANPWQVRQWPRTQPWQQERPARHFARDTPRPIDPQNDELPDTMTWDDYRAIPGTHWNDPSRKGSIKNFAGALVLIDYPGRSFVVSQPKNATIYGNPNSAGDVPRDQVPRFYRDFLNTPDTLNHGHTLNEFWMEDSGGRYGIDLTAFGPYRMPAKSHEYGVERGFQGSTGCPAGDTCGRDLRKDARAAWIAEVGERTAARYDFVFFLSAGQDESSTWQEFGPMKFGAPGAVPDEWGPPDPALPNWNKTRYVGWTSWQAAANLWPNAASGSSI